MRVKNMIRLVPSATCMFVVVWLAISGFVFKVRHPWVTDTETLLNLPTVMTFGTVEYEKMRPRSRD